MNAVGLKEGRKKTRRKNAKLNILKVSRKVVEIVEIYWFVPLTPSPCAIISDLSFFVF
jgi:hypothetical protein